MFGRKTNIKKIAHKYRLYESTSKCKTIDSLLRTTGKMWNRGLNAIREHYKKTGKYLSPKEVYAILKKERESNEYWQMINSQTMQEVAQRLDTAYQRFFKKLAKRPPKFKPTMYFQSLVLKVSGYKVRNNQLILPIGKGKNRKIKQFKFIDSRNQNYYHENSKQRNIFNARLKRDLHGRYWVIFTVKQAKQTYKTRKTRGAIGADFGLNTYMTVFDGKQFLEVENPEFLKSDLDLLREKSKTHSRKKKGSKNKNRAKKELGKVYQNVSNRRSDWQSKKAHDLCRAFKFIGLEDLNMKAMQRMWGRKISDLGHSRFVHKLKHVAAKYG
ncbi:MAG: RNA-guided endonuclease InsQ/TnpB family protein, partial [Chitinophagales bacterium]